MLYYVFLFSFCEAGSDGAWGVSEKKEVGSVGAKGRAEMERQADYTNRAGINKCKM